MVLFLTRYKQNLSLDDRAFFSCFSLAIYDLLETRQEQSRTKEIKERYGSELFSKLEQAYQETTQVNRHANGHTTHELLGQCLKGKYQRFCRELMPFLQVFVWEYQKQYLNTLKH